MSEKPVVRDFLFRGLMFDAEAERFRAAGIQIGSDDAAAEVNLLEEALRPFPVDLRTESLKMSRLYALLYAFENSVRSLITERLEEKYGADWWNTKVPKKVRDFAAKMQEDAKKNSWLETARRDPVSFIQFGHLSDTITDNWEDFSDLIPSQHWIKQRMDELEKSRNAIAHNRMLLPGEFQRLDMYINDWNRMVGL